MPVLPVQKEKALSRNGIRESSLRAGNKCADRAERSYVAASSLLRIRSKVSVWEKKVHSHGASLATSGCLTARLQQIKLNNQLASNHESERHNLSVSNFLCECPD